MNMRKTVLPIKHIRFAAAIALVGFALLVGRSLQNEPEADTRAAVKYASQSSVSTHSSAILTHSSAEQISVAAIPNGPSTTGKHSPAVQTSGLPVPRTVEVDLPGKRIEARVKKAEVRSDTDYSWFGKVDGDPQSSIVLTVKDDTSIGYIETSGRSYSVTNKAGRPTVTENKPELAAESDRYSLVPPKMSADPTEPAVAGSGPAAEPTDPVDDGSRIDVLVLYTQAMAAKYGGGITAEVQSMVDLTNNAYANSGVVTRLDLAGTGLFTEQAAEATDISTALGQIRTNATIAAMRESVKADLVSLVRVYPGGAPYCGLGYIMQTVGNSFAPYAFSVTEVLPAAEANPYYCHPLTFAHEIGHNLGSAHDRDHAANAGAYSYSYGHDVPGVFGTVMSYDGPKISYFSTPLVSYGGFPIGIASGASSADNVMSINNVAATAANFRVATPPSTEPDISVSPASMNFGFAQSGTPAAPATITVSNDGVDDLNVSSVSVIGAASSDFTIASEGCTASPIAASASCTIGVVFDPTAAGTRTSSIVISSDDPDESSTSVTLEGVGSIGAPAPVTAVKTSPAADRYSGWLRGKAPKISLKPSIRGRTYYQWDSSSDSSWSVYDGRPIPAMLGTHTLYFRSLSNAGGIENLRSQTFRMDPAVPGTPSPAATSLITGTAATSASDYFFWSTPADPSPGSGIAGYSYNWDRKSRSTPDGIQDISEGGGGGVSLSAPTDGNWYLHVRAKDIAGNLSPVAHLGPYIVDTVIPATTLTSKPSSPNGTAGWYRTVPIIRLRASERFASIDYQWDGTSDATWSTFYRPFYAPWGTHTLYYRARDRVPNLESTKQATYNVGSPSLAARLSPMNSFLTGASSPSQ